MIKFLKILSSIIVFGLFAYIYMQIILIMLLLPMFFIFGDVEMNPNIFYGIIILISMILSFFVTKAIFYPHYKEKDNLNSKR